MMFLRFIDEPHKFPFELILSPEQTQAFIRLLSVLKGGEGGGASECVQEVSFVFLKTPNEHITNDRFSCSLIRYIIISHLLLDGTFEPASNVVPDLSCLQFCMRASGVFEAYNSGLNGTSEGLLS
jgi:hypothetical protein